MRTVLLAAGLPAGHVGCDGAGGGHAGPGASVSVASALD